MIDDEFTATLSQLRPGEAEAIRLGAVSLELRRGPGAPARYDVAGPRVTLGRGPACDVVLDDASLSTTHCEIELGDARVVLRELGSRNGTWVGPARVLDRVALPDGAEFIVGGCHFAVRFGPSIAVPLAGTPHFHGMHGHSDAMREIFALLDRLGPTPLTTLVLGETGTGKEEVARALHAASQRRGPFVVLDCGSLPHALAESVVFGHRKGAFTGAIADRPGCFEEADGGTLFIDEIGELPLELQPKLLRALDRREVVRIGEHVVRAVDVRVIAATNRELRKAIGEGTFRLDLYHRLAHVIVQIPPLRQRPQDIEPLARHFAAMVSDRVGRQFSLDQGALARLRDQPWEGNVRQLRHVVERACLLASSDVITRNEIAAPGLLHDSECSIDPGAAERALYQLPLKQALEQVGDAFARRYCEHLLSQTGGDLDLAATRAQYTRKGLRELLRRLGL
ncbi:MAG: sigma 54-interacting transcriptional regulator [Nannocystaceae bacterium]